MQDSSGVLSFSTAKLFSQRDQTAKAVVYGFVVALKLSTADLRGCRVGYHSIALSLFIPLLTRAKPY